MWAISIIAPIKKSRSKRVFNEKILESIYSWCFVLCEMHLYSLQTMVTNEMPHFSDQGSRECNVAMSDKVFRFWVCISAEVIQTAPFSHSCNRRIWVGKGWKTREQNELKQLNRKVLRWGLGMQHTQGASWGHFIWNIWHSLCEIYTKATWPSWQCCKMVPNGGVFSLLPELTK